MMSLTTLGDQKIDNLKSQFQSDEFNLSTKNLIENLASLKRKTLKDVSFFFNAIRIPDLHSFCPTPVTEHVSLHKPIYMQLVFILNVSGSFSNLEFS